MTTNLIKDEENKYLLHKYPQELATRQISTNKWLFREIEKVAEGDTIYMEFSLQ